MPRTKEEIVQELAKRKVRVVFDSYGWADLVQAIQEWTPQQRGIFVDAVKALDKKGIDMIHKALLTKAEAEAIQLVQGYLSDDTLDLAEIDELL